MPQSHWFSHTAGVSFAWCCMKWGKVGRKKSSFLGMPFAKISGVWAEKPPHYPENISQNLYDLQCCITKPLEFQGEFEEVAVRRRKNFFCFTSDNIWKIAESSHNHNKSFLYNHFPLVIYQNFTKYSSTSSLDERLIFNIFIPFIFILLII